MSRIHSYILSWKKRCLCTFRKSLKLYRPSSRQENLNQGGGILRTLPRPTRDMLFFFVYALQRYKFKSRELEPVQEYQFYQYWSRSLYVFVLVQISLLEPQVPCYIQLPLVLCNRDKLLLQHGIRASGLGFHFYWTPQLVCFFPIEFLCRSLCRSHSQTDSILR